jgi:hypothetical protein
VASSAPAAAEQPSQPSVLLVPGRSSTSEEKMHDVPADGRGRVERGAVEVDRAGATTADTVESGGAGAADAAQAVAERRDLHAGEGGRRIGQRQGRRDRGR